MMKKTIQFVSIITIAMAGTMSSCVDSGKGLYDPLYGTPNPTGNGFAAPDDIDRNMTTIKNVSVEMKDEEGGLFAYLVEIYAEDPLTNESASVLVARAANREDDFKSTTTASLLSTQKGIYVKQTDPREREQVYQFDMPESSGNITCKLYYTGSTAQNRASMSRAIATRGLPFEKPDYYSIPANAKEVTEMSGTTLLRDASYKITSDYADTFRFDGRDGEVATKVYTDAKWTVPVTFQFQNGIEIIVMNNAKIEASGTITFTRNSMLTVMEKGEVNAENISFTNGAPAASRNWGALTVASTIILHSGTTLYSKGTITSKNISINSNTEIVNDNKISLKGELNLPSNFSLENSGEIYRERLIANSDAVATNNSTMKFTTINLTNTTVNNACSMKATTSFYANGATFDFTQGYLKAPKMEFVNGTVDLSGGSMLDATASISVPPGYAKSYGRGENTSMIRSPAITEQGFTCDGDLVIECNSHAERNQWWENFHVLNGTYFTKIGNSKVIIDVYTGVKDDENEGGDPEDPKFPIIMDDSRGCACLFEDQWPLHGDYDMNDLVLIIKEGKISINGNNKAEEFTLSLDLSAARATKSIGATIMLDGIPAGTTTQPMGFSDDSLLESFNVNSNLIKNGQSYAVIPLFDGAHKALGRDRYEQVDMIASHSTNTSPKNISFTIEFNNPISMDKLSINRLNVLIFVKGNRNQRKEIHVVGYQPAKLASTDLFGGSNDDSSTSRRRYYINKDNLVQGIMVPIDFKWPLEYVNIKSAYSLFESWMASGGTKNEEWWRTFDSSKVYK